jgi:hypothetical protein
MEHGVYLLSRAQQIIIINTRTYDHPPLFTTYSLFILTLLFALAAV